eukprot:CAMPEP_0182597426 /NCGR_PEP_ID=MMETSP1324-20130603/86213_1 /TAXON_ID=236786 /ORGANISM="Florenciella sp., Strain RCC1587" /LENGTH=275 /DNA_ID=CAMNT_0024815169 /DNA_START=21 /DNA_END=844 /DNA_ORIENTATION=-
MLLAGEDQSDAMQKFVQERASVITATLFKVFQSDSCGSFHHACHVICHLLENHTDQVLGVIGANLESLNTYLNPMLSCVQHSPVAETLVKLVSCPTMTPKVRWSLYTSLSARKFLLLLAERATGTDPAATEAERTPAHCSACAEVFSELTDRLAVDPHGGELLLQPIGHCPELLDGLLASVCGTRQADGTIRHRPYRQRLDAAQALQRLVAKATHDELPAASPMGDMNSFAAMGMAPEMVKNQLMCVAEQIHMRLGASFHDLAVVVAGLWLGSIL